MVDDFCVKYSGKENALHLKVGLEKNKLATDWKGDLYIGIEIKWDYEKGTVRTSMSGYVRAALYDFQHEKPK